MIIKMVNYKIYFIALLIIIICCSCSGTNNPIEPIALIEYRAGEVIVGFPESVDYKFIRSFINELKLTALSISADSSFAMWIQVDSGQIQNHMYRLQQDTAVAWADQRGYPFDLDRDPSKNYILTQFRGTIKINYALSLIQSIAGLSWKKTLLPGRSALIGVPIGKELFWINVLKKYSFVKYAELNSITHVN
jgi:hypothetical protein